MNAVRKVYADLPASIGMPRQLHHRHVEVIIFPLETLDSRKGRRHTSTSASLTQFAGSWSGEPLVREAQGHYEIRKELR